MSGKIPVGVLGATGFVGQHFLALLANHPWFEVKALFASQDYDSYPAQWRATLPPPAWLDTVPVRRLSAESVLDSGVRLVFSGVPADVARQVERSIVAAGVPVFSNASAFRMADDVPILIPEINSDHLAVTGRPLHVTNSNCAISGLAITLAALRPLGLKRVRVATYQALSGAGYPGVPSYDALGNLIPHIPSEEDKIAAEGRRILGTVEDGSIVPVDLDIEAQVVRVPVHVGHFEVSFVDVARETSVEEVAELFRAFCGPEDVMSLPMTPEEVIHVFDGTGRPQPRTDVMLGGGMTVSVGHIKVKGTSISYKLLVNNLVRGAAGGSVQNAELAHVRGLLG